MKTSIWAEWFKQNGMHYAEERERMSDQLPVGKIEQLSDKPPTIKQAFANVRKRLSQIDHKPHDIDLLGGMLQQQADEIKRLKGELQKKFRELMPSTVERIAELEETLRLIRAIVVGEDDPDGYVWMEGAPQQIIDLCDGVLNED